MEISDFYNEEYLDLLKRYQLLQKKKNDIYNVAIEMSFFDRKWENYSKHLKYIEKELIKTNMELQKLEPRKIYSDKVTLVLDPERFLWYYDIYNSNNRLVGNIEFRGHHIDNYSGDVGYSILEEHRGSSYAYHALCVLGELIKAKGYNDFWVSSKYNNISSIKTIKKYGGKLIEEDEGVYLFNCSAPKDNSIKVLVK